MSIEAFDKDTFGKTPLGSAYISISKILEESYSESEEWTVPLELKNAHTGELSFNLLFHKASS